jgi:short subunit dehydrogenase-like uncharacterized protein
MLYGAYGTTGRLILKEALKRGHRPLLGGRDPSRLSALAAEADLEALPLDLNASGSLNGVSAVLNAAGPYHLTGEPLRRRCLEAGVSYLDVNGEMQDFVAALGADTEARKRGVAVIPGAGFGVVFGEALAAHAAQRLGDASWLRLSFATANALQSNGAVRSTAAVMAAGGYAVEDGVLRERPIAYRTWRVADARYAAAPRPELVAALRVTGIPEILAGVPLSLPAAMLMRFAGKLVGRMMLRTSARAGAEKPAATINGAEFRSRVWAEAGNAAGRRIACMLETGEGYQMAATAAVHSVEKALAERPIGALTPAQAFGARFAVSLPDTRIVDLPV